MDAQSAFEKAIACFDSLDEHGYICEDEAAAVLSILFESLVEQR